MRVDETGLGLHRVLDLGELRRHARRLLERNSVQGEEGVPRELRREAERAGGIEVRRPVDEGRHAAGPRDRERDFERAFGLGSRRSGTAGHVTSSAVLDRARQVSRAARMANRHDAATSTCPAPRARRPAGFASWSSTTIE